MPAYVISYWSPVTGHRSPVIGRRSVGPRSTAHGLRPTSLSRSRWVMCQRHTSGSQRSTDRGLKTVCDDLFLLQSEHVHARFTSIDLPGGPGGRRHARRRGSVGRAAGRRRPPALTADDYARAERFMGYNTTPLVFRTAVRPNWLTDDRFWYRNTVPGGAEFILVDPARATRERAFDHEQAGRRRLSSAASERVHGDDAAVHRDRVHGRRAVHRVHRGQAAVAMRSAGAACTALGVDARDRAAAVPRRSRRRRTRRRLA